MATEQDGSGWDFLDSFNTGGKYHKIWEAVEDGGKDVWNKTLEDKPAPPPPPQKKAMQDEYKAIQSQGDSNRVQTEGINGNYLIIGAVGVFLLMGSM